MTIHLVGKFIKEKAIKTAVFVLSLVTLLTWAKPSNAFTCGFAWAKIGTYSFTGNFRKKKESAGAKLNRACKVYFQIPNAITTSVVKKRGNCLFFTFRVYINKRDPKTKRQLYYANKALWCNKTAIITWRGKDFKATVRYHR